MSKSIEDLYKIIEQMESTIGELEAKVSHLEEENKTLKTENARLSAENAALRKKLYGTGKSEKVDPRQDELFDEEEVQLQIPETDNSLIHIQADYFKKKGKQPKLSKEEKYKHLPTRKEIEYIPEEVKQNPEAYERIGEEITFEIEPNDRGFSKTVHKRIKFRPKEDKSKAPIIAPAPKQLVQGSIASTSWIVSILMDKYLDHLPLDRQCRIAKRFGVEVTVKNMCDWIGKAAEGLEGVYNEILQELKTKNYLQADETPIDYLPERPPDKKAKKGCKKGYFWLLNDPLSYVYYHWSLSRAADNLSDLLGIDWNGLLQCDGYSAYKSWGSLNKNPTTLGSCLVHIRRKFMECYEQGERKYSPWFLRQISWLYHWEDQCKAQSPKLREVMRSSHHSMVLNRMEKVLRHLEAKKTILPESKIGKAISYALDQWEGLLACVNDGRAELDNNRIENAVRPTKLGLKNWLFVGHKNAGKRAAIFYTLIENCKRFGICVKSYLTDILDQVAQAPSIDNIDYTQFLPKNWIANRYIKKTPLLKAA